MNKFLTALGLLLSVPAWAAQPPAPATQAEVNAGSATYKFVSPYTLQHATLTNAVVATATNAIGNANGVGTNTAIWGLSLSNVTANRVAALNTSGNLTNTGTAPALFDNFFLMGVSNVLAASGIALATNNGVLWITNTGTASSGTFNTAQFEALGTGTNIKSGALLTNISVWGGLTNNGTFTNGNIALFGSHVYVGATVNFAGGIVDDTLTMLAAPKFNVPNIDTNYLLMLNTSGNLTHSPLKIATAFSGLADGQVLKYDSTTATWTNEAESGSFSGFTTGITNSTSAITNSAATYFGGTVDLHGMTTVRGNTLLLTRSADKVLLTDAATNIITSTATRQLFDNFFAMGISNILAADGIALATNNGVLWITNVGAVGSENTSTNANQFGAAGAVLTIKAAPLLTNIQNYGGITIIPTSDNGTPQIVSSAYSNVATLIRLDKARSTVSGSTAVKAGDQLAQIYARGKGDTAYLNGFVIAPYALTDFSDASAETLTLFDSGFASASTRTVWALSPYNWTNMVNAYFTSNLTVSGNSVVTGTLKVDGTNVGLSGTITNIVRTPTQTSSNILFDGSLGEYFVYTNAIHTGGWTNLVFTNLQIGQKIVADVNFTNATAKVKVNAIEFPANWYIGGAATAVGTNGWSRITVLCSATATNIQVDSIEYTLAAINGLTLSTNFPTGVISIVPNAVLTNLVQTVANNVTNENSTALQINSGTVTLSPGVVSNLNSSTIDVPGGANNIVSNVNNIKFATWTNYVQTVSNFVFSFNTNSYELKNQTNVVFTNIVEEATAVKADMTVHIHNTTGVTMGLVWPAYGAQHGYFFQTNANNAILAATSLASGQHGVASFTAYGTNIFATFTTWP